MLKWFWNFVAVAKGEMNSDFKLIVFYINCVSYLIQNNFFKP